MVSLPGRTNYFVVCADNLGLSLLLQGALSPIATPEDIVFHDAATITKEKARQIETESRFAPRAGSALSHFFIYSLQELPRDSVGPLLKAVEEAKFSRFIFQSQVTSPHTMTLRSRSSVVKLPFLSRRMVLGNMRAMNHDARTADQMGLWDGTLTGTIRALAMKDTMTAIKREVGRGERGLTALFSDEIIGSLAFDAATDQLFDGLEKGFLQRRRTPSRQRLALYRALSRVG